jgi:hypothetical protein
VSVFFGPVKHKSGERLRDEPPDAICRLENAEVMLSTGNDNAE